MMYTWLSKQNQIQEKMDKYLTRNTPVKISLTLCTLNKTKFKKHEHLSDTEHSSFNLKDTWLSLQYQIQEALI